jgi:hypothetical protein
MTKTFLIYQFLFIAHCAMLKGVFIHLGAHFEQQSETPKRFAKA